jgi:hypothetical protein
MNTVQREYLRNAQKAVRVAGSVTWNPVAYAHQVRWAEAYWQNYLKSMEIKGFQQRMAELKAHLVRQDTQGALMYLGSAGRLH